MSEMNSFYQMGEGPTDMTLVVNTANSAVQALKDASSEKKEQAVKQIYYLALLAYRPLTPEELTDFVGKNVALLESFLKI